MELMKSLLPHEAASLGIALVVSSNTPLVLLDESLVVVAASSSFCNQFGLDAATVVGSSFFDLGNGEWNVPQLGSLLRATVANDPGIEGYEFGLKRPGVAPVCLSVHAHMLDIATASERHVVVAIADITSIHAANKIRDQLVRDKQILLDELQHRVANSLQIIASVLMQSARRVQSDEARLSLHDAHHRVMSIATLQRQLAATQQGKVKLRAYFTDLCASIGASMIGDPSLIRIAVTVDDSEMGSDASVSLGLIVTELVINALKHAFPGRTQRGTIAVGYRSSGGDWTLTVADDGVGMPTDAAKAKPGLGTGMIEALAKQLGATIVMSATTPGTIITVARTGVIAAPTRSV